MQSQNFLQNSVNFENQKITQEKLLEMLDKSTFRAVNVSNCLEIYNSLPRDEDFKEKFFVKLGGVEELIYQNSKMEDSDLLIGGRAIKSELYNLKTQIQSFDDDSKRHFCAGLSELFLKNASLISKNEFKILEELDPNFDQNNPNFKKQFLQKVGEEFNVLRKNKEFWEGNVEALTRDKTELRGYFCEGLSNALTQFQPKTAIGLRNSYQLFELLREKPVIPTVAVGLISKFVENKSNFAESSKTKIDENLKNFPQKFAQSFVDFLTNVKDESESGKKEANDLIDEICKSDSLEHITEIKTLLDRNLSRYGETITAPGIKVIKIQTAFTQLGGQEEPLVSDNQGGIILDDGSRLSSLRGVSEDDRQQQSFLSSCANLFACIRSDRERENGGGPFASQSLASNRGNQTQQPALTNSMGGTVSPSTAEGRVNARLVFSHPLQQSQ